MTRAALTPEQARQAVELRDAGLSWATIARRVGCSPTAARTVAVRELHAAGRQLAPTRPGRPYGSRTTHDLYKESLARAWRSRRWSWRVIARALGMPEQRVIKWLR